MGKFTLCATVGILYILFHFNIIDFTEANEKTSVTSRVDKTENFQKSKIPDTPSTTRLNINTESYTLAMEEDAKTKLGSFSRDCDDLSARCIYLHPSTAKNQTGLYIQFSAAPDGSKINNPKLTVKYIDEDLILVNRILFNIDGEQYILPKGKWHKNYDRGYITETNYRMITNYEYDMLQKIIHSEKTEVQLKGTKGSSTFIISKEEKEAMDELFFVYHGLDKV